MESYTYFFLFVLLFAFTGVAAAVLLHEKRVLKQLQEENKLLLSELRKMQKEIQATKNEYSTFTKQTVRISVSTTTVAEGLKKLILSIERLKKEAQKIKIYSNRKKQVIIRKQPLPKYPILSSRAETKKRRIMGKGVAYGRF